MKEKLKQTDFFSSPASTKYHGSFAGGLLAHSLEVYYQIRKLSPVYGYCRNESEIESATLVSLFHDVCKINSYEVSVRNIKNPSGNWESVPCYIYSNKKDFGAHGAESIYIITQHLMLTREETIAIYHHMGAWDASKYDNDKKLKIRRIYDMIPSNLENKKKRVVVQNIENKKGKRFSFIKLVNLTLFSKILSFLPSIRQNRGIQRTR